MRTRGTLSQHLSNLFVQQLQTQQLVVELVALGGAHAVQRQTARLLNLHIHGGQIATHFVRLRSCAPARFRRAVQGIVDRFRLGLVLCKKTQSVSSYVRGPQTWHYKPSCAFSSLALLTAAAASCDAIVTAAKLPTTRVRADAPTDPNMAYMATSVAVLVRDKLLLSAAESSPYESERDELFSAFERWRALPPSWCT